MHVITTVRLSFPEVIVHRHFSGICWHSSSISSQFGGRLSVFCGIYNVFKISNSIGIGKGIMTLKSIFRGSVTNDFLLFKNCEKIGRC